MLPRRNLLTSALSIGALTLSGCRQPNASGKRTALGSRIAVRDLPAPIIHIPLKREVASESDLASLLRHTIPDHRWTKYPIAYVYHTLRLWGKSASFSSRQFINSRVRNDGWGASAFGSLIDDAIFEEVVSAFGKPLLVPSEFGVAVLTTKDPEWGREWASTHPGKFEQVMAELGVHSKQKLAMRAEGEFTLGDVLNDSARRIHRDVECEWSAVGLASYLDADCWQNRFGQWITFDDMAGWLLSCQFGEGACRGTHVPFATAVLCQLAENGYRTLRAGTCHSLRSRLRETVQLLSGGLGRDGAWPEYWWPRSSRSDEADFRGLGAEFVKILVTGHHLEWMSLCEHRDRPEEHVLERAIVYLLKRIPDYAEVMKKDWFVFLPISHAVRAVCKLQGIEWPSEALL